MWWRISSPTTPESNSMSKKRMKKIPGGAPMTFEKAVKASPSIASSSRKGIQALKSEHRKGLKNGDVATGSIDLDAALANTLPNDHRWDYGIGLPGKGGGGTSALARSAPRSERRD